MKTRHDPFVEIMKRFEYTVDMRTAFDDFLTLAICSFGQNPGAGKSFDEELYLQIIAPYKNDPIRFEFPNLLAALILEMERRMDSSEGWDVLGEFYEQHISRGRLGQYFTPWSVCKLMAECSFEQHIASREEKKPLRILDPSCGSGRMLLAASRIGGPCERYYAIDIDHTCVKMCSLNLFLSGCFCIEAMQANALVPEDFRVSYYTSFVPFGLFRRTAKEDSVLWHMYQTTFEKKTKVNPEPPTMDGFQNGQGEQLTIF